MGHFGDESFQAITCTGIILVEIKITQNKREKIQKKHKNPKLNV